MVQEVVDQHGRIDILVNNAAIFDLAPILEITERSYDRLFAVNVKGLLFTMLAVARQMVAQGRGGRIVNIASDTALWGAPRLMAYVVADDGELASERLHVAERARGQELRDELLPGDPGGRGADAQRAPEPVGQLAAALGVTFQQIQKYENGQSQVTPERLVALASALARVVFPTPGISSTSRCPLHRSVTVAIVTVSLLPMITRSTSWTMASA